MAEELSPLIDACLAGDQSAVVRFVRRYERRVFAICWRMLGHRQDAEDAAQETFVRALRSLKSWDRGRPLEPWLLAIAANRCRTTLARRAKKPAGVPLFDHDVPVGDHLPAARQLAEEVDRALATLRHEYAEAFRLFHEEELAYADIARVLDCPLGTVKTWVYRARRKIIAELYKRGVLEEKGVGKHNEQLRTNRAATQRVAR